MSRIGKLLINIPDNVKITVDKINNVLVTGPKGELKQKIDNRINVIIENSILRVEKTEESIELKAKHGLSRALLQNMVIGVSKGFRNDLEVVGVGYRVNAQNQKLELSLGFSHNILMVMPKEIKVTTFSERGKNPIITLESHDKQLLGEITAKIKSLRKSEPYKGKGIKFVGEVLRRKVGKSAKK